MAVKTSNVICKYWNKKGKFQELYDEISFLVPPQGTAPTEIGEKLRIVGNIYYDIYNNGGCAVYFKVIKV